MTILDTFYILFNSNTEDLSKGFKRTKFESSELEKQLKSMTEQTDGLGKSFVKMIEVGAGLVAGYLGFSALKNGILDVAKFNSNLGYTASLTGQVVQNLKQMGVASAQQGGTVEGAISNIQTVQSHFAAAGLPVPTPEELMSGWRETLKGRDTKTQLAMFDKLGIQDIGLKTQAVMSAADYNKNWTEAGRNTVTSDKDVKAAQDFLRSETELAQAFDKLEQTIGTPILTALGNFLKGIVDITDFLSTAEGRKTIPQAAGAMAKDLSDGTKNVISKGINTATELLYNKRILKENRGDITPEQDAELEKYRRKSSPSLSQPSSAANPPPLTQPLDPGNGDPTTAWQKAVLDPAYIKKIQATGQTDIYATEASKAFSSQVNHVNGSKSVSVGNVTIHTQATDGQGTADAFRDMLSNLAGNSSDGVSK